MKKIRTIFICVMVIVLSFSLVGCSCGVDKKAVDSTYMDQYGNVKVNAFVDMNGSEIVFLLEERGYKWDEKYREFRTGFSIKDKTKPSNVDLFTYYTDYLERAEKADYNYNKAKWIKDEYLNASNKGDLLRTGGIRYAVDGYYTENEHFKKYEYDDSDYEYVINVEDAFNNIVNIETYDKYISEDKGTILCRFTDSNGQKYYIKLTSDIGDVIDVTCIENMKNEISLGKENSHSVAVTIAPESTLVKNFESYEGYIKYIEHLNKVLK